MKKKTRPTSRKMLRNLGISRFLNYSSGVKVGNKKFIIPLTGNSSDALFSVDKGFKSAILELLSGAADTNCFVDVGANLGQTMLEAYSFNEKIRYFGFEPNPDAFIILQKLAEINSLDASLFPWACSTDSKPLKIFTKNAVDSSATMVPEIRPNVYENMSGKWISCYPLDQINSSLNLSNNFVMKIDVEGAELEVICGAHETIRNLRPAIICEVLHAHRPTEIPHNDARKLELEKTLDSLDYDLYICNFDQYQNLLGITKIREFQKGITWGNSPNTCDYLFLPKEMRPNLLA